MRPPGGKRRSGKTDLFARDRDLLPAQQVAIEAPRAVEVANVEDEVAELLHLHELTLAPS